jgi:hypothetical protein
VASTRTTSCPPAWTAPSAGLDGTDCQLATGMYVDGLEDGASYDVYTLTGAAGDSIELTLRSEDFDAFLLVAYMDEEV